MGRQVDASKLFLVWTLLILLVFREVIDEMWGGASEVHNVVPESVDIGLVHQALYLASSISASKSVCDRSSVFDASLMSFLGRLL